MKRFYAQSRLWSDTLDLGILVVERQGERYQEFSSKLSLEPHPEGDEIVEPTMRLTKDEARELMDALWYAGVRPSSGDGNTGQLGATQKHLEDMRRLVFKE